MDVDRQAFEPFRTCNRVRRVKEYLVSSGHTLTPSGGRLLDQLLRLGPRFTAGDIVDADADPAARDGAAYLLDFLCELGVLHEQDGCPRTYVRNADLALCGSVACVVCGGDWPMEDSALASLRRAICLAPNFLVVLHTLKVVGICPACRVT